MPFIIPFIVPLITAATAAVGIWQTAKASSQANRANAAAASQNAAALAKAEEDKIFQASQDRMSKARAIRSLLPGLQDKLGGSVSPDYYSQVAALLSGNADALAVAKDTTFNWFGQSKGSSGGAASTNAWLPTYTAKDYANPWKWPNSGGG